jgi:restriction system protein
MLKLHPNSLFAILLRSQWWISALIAGVLFAVIAQFLPMWMAVFSASPFLVIAGYAGWKQLRAPSAAKVATILERLSALPREEFTAALEAGWRREGYQVERPQGGAYDLELRREGRLTVVCCRRWKAGRVGIEPLRELHAAAGKQADDLLYVAVGEVTEQARSFAVDHRVRIVEGAELARLAG